MSFQYHMDNAKSERISSYNATRVVNYINNVMARELAGSDFLGANQSMASKNIVADEFLRERMMGFFYRGAPHLRGALPEDWMVEVSNHNFCDSANNLTIRFDPPLKRPAAARGMYLPISVLTKEEWQRYGLFTEEESRIKEMRDSLQDLTQLISGFVKCSGFVTIHRNKWMVDRLPMKLLSGLLPGHTWKVIKDFRKEFDALPPRKDTKTEAPENLGAALAIMDIYKLKEE